MYRAAIIGLGKIGMEYDLSSAVHPLSHVFGYMMDNDYQLICAMDIQADQAEKLHKIAPQVRFYKDLEMMLRENPLDIISICTPPIYHYKTICYIVRHTHIKYIFCEKPIVEDEKEAEDLKRLLQGSDILVVPNISRRWNPGLIKMQKRIASLEWGKIQKVHVQYTRGIYNTGSHMFDLLHWTIGKISRVQVVSKVYTTSELEHELSFSFNFFINDNVVGYAEAFNDVQYYLFAFDLYFEKGKIEIRNSGDDVLYYRIQQHHLYPAFQELSLVEHERNLLKDSCMANALHNLNRVMAKAETPHCCLQDAIYPLYVAKALEKSYRTGKWERVDFDE